MCQHFYPEMLSTGLLITQLAVGLAKRGWSIRVYCGQPVYTDAAKTMRASAKCESYHGVEIVRVGALGSGRRSLLSRGLNWLTFLGGVAFAVWRDRHTLDGIVNTTNPSIIGIVPLLLKLIVGLPFVTIVHDVYPDVAVRLGVLNAKSPLTRIWEGLTRQIFRHSRGLITLGHDMATLVAEKTGAANVPIVVIPNWADPAKIRPIPREVNQFAQQHNPDAQFLVQYAGRMGRTHNLEPLLDAAVHLQADPIQFQFIGDGAKRATLAQRTQEHRLANVQFLPYQPFSQLAETLSTADLAVVCLDDAFTSVSVPSKTYSAMACGLPILALLDPASEIGRTIETHNCGIVLPNATGSQVAHHIKMLANNKHERDQLGKNALDAFQTYFTVDKAVDAHHENLQAWFHQPTAVTRPSLAYRVFRQFINWAFVTAGAMLLAILLPIVWLANLFTSRGPLFYWQTRIGKDKQQFQMLKLRTMVVDAEVAVPQWAEEDDPRVTKIGRILRKTHLDELPQIYNILRGHMNLIGPRPERPEFTTLLAQQLPRYHERHTLKPGLTGWAQIHQNYSASLEEAAVKLGYDLEYVQQRNWQLDLVILAHTARISAGLNGR